MRKEYVRAAKAAWKVKSLPWTGSRVAVDRKAGERDVAEITRTLRQVGVITRGELLSLGRTPRSARAMKIPDRIDEAAGCQARRELLRPERTEVLTLPLRSPRRTAEREEVGAGL